MTQHFCVAMGLIALVLSMTTSTAAAAQRVPIRFDVPASLSQYTGPCPVTFGVPFSRGELRKSDGVRLVDASGKVSPGQFEITATWSAQGDEVRWLLIDAQAQLRAGKPEPLFLEFGSDVPRESSFAPMTARVEANNTAVIDTGAGQWRINARGGDAGRFVLRDGSGTEYIAQADAPADSLQIEKSGPVRTVVKLTGHYTDSAGRKIAEHVTRVRFFAGCPFVRIYHTMIWLTDDATTIASLSWRLPAKGRAEAGVDGRAVQAANDGTLTLRQERWDTVTGSATGSRLDGFVQATSDTQTLFAALRWPWQQYPVAMIGDGANIGIDLIGPSSPMSLKATDVAVPGVMKNVPAWNLRIFRGGVPGDDVAFNGPPALPHLTPRGVAKTWELLVWRDDAKTSLAAAVKNAFVQQPVLAFADPAFATRAAEPSPASPCDPKTFPEIESALQRAYDWYTLERGDDGDFGTWNHGDVQWDWTHSGTPIYRYWMNNGKGWSILPWALWIRSGDRRYWDTGEANSRHVMDVDTCHVPEWPRDQKDFRLRGGQYHYSAVHWGYGPEVFTYYVDSEYLPYCYYMTGYERARDVMFEHAEAMARWEQRDAWMAHFRQEIRSRAGRHLYVMIKNLIELHRATWDPRLEALAKECLDLTLAAQLDDGNFPHVKTNHYLDQPLLMAGRFYGWNQVGPALRRWTDFMGDPLRAGPTGCNSGPMSLWSAVTLHEQSGDARYLDVAARVMQTQALSVVDGDTSWRGLSCIPGHEAGPTLRDWPVVMAALVKSKTEKQTRDLLPMAAFHSRLPVSKEMTDQGWAMRHAALTLSTTSDAFTIRLSFMQRPTHYRLRVIAPDGSVVATAEEDVPSSLLAFETFTKQITVPSGARTGVFAIEVDAKGRPEFAAALSLESSTGKLVHIMPEGPRTFCAALNVGQFFVRPLPNREISLGFPLNSFVQGRTVLLDPDGQIVATSSVTGSRKPKETANPVSFAAELPQGEMCRARVSAIKSGLYSFVLPNEGKWGHTFDLRGFEPWISATPQTWFDPMTHPHPDLSTYGLREK